MLADVAVCLKYMHENYGITIRRFDETAVKQIGKFLHGKNGYDLENSYFEEIFFLCLADINAPVDIKNGELYVKLGHHNHPIAHLIRQAQLMVEDSFLTTSYTWICNQQKDKISVVKTIWWCEMHYTILPFRIYIDA